MEIDENDLIYIQKIKKFNSTRNMVFSLGLPMYFIFNTLINWDILGEKGSWSIISISLLIAAIIFSHWRTQQKLVNIIDKIKDNKMMEEDIL
jgi:drug/metabolite transporter (DMT)-like permease